MRSKLPEELKKQIKIEANEIYWQTHKASIARDPYTRGLTMFEVAQVPLINALIEKEERYLELKERCEKMEAALLSAQRLKTLWAFSEPVSPEHLNEAVALEYMANKIDEALAFKHEGINEKEGEDAGT